jgi:hypothetical protein
MNAYMTMFPFHQGTAVLSRDFNTQHKSFYPAVPPATATLPLSSLCRFISAVQDKKM